MLSRVLRALKETPAIGQIVVSIESEALLRSVPDTSGVRFAPSAATLADSVLAAVETLPSPWPLLITTADNALHTPEMLTHFCVKSAASTADVTVAMTPAKIILARYPTGIRAFHRFKDGDASGCNLYGLRDGRALTAVQAFAGGGQFGKKPWRIVKAFGVSTFVLHMLRRLTLDDAMTRIGRGFGLTAEAVTLPFPAAPIDIDSVADLKLAEEILRERATAVC
jgi:GTP:adenosylcobinamide-phosphate guanylyltransferase